MSPLVLLPLLAAACVAAPGGIFRSGLIQNGGLIQTGFPVGGAFGYSAIGAPLVQQVQQVQVQVPLTKTVHYETKPVVTGYSTSIIKPAIATGFAAAPFAQVAPVVVQEQPTLVQAQPAPIAVEAPAQDAVVVEARAAAPAPVAIAQAPAQFAYAQAPAPVAIAQPVVAFRAAQAGDFEPLVTKEKVLAPVRAHTEITPQVTQIQQEVTVRKVIHDVPVAQPIAVQTPVTYAVHNPVVAAGPQAIAYSNVGQFAYGANVLNGQVVGGQVFNGQVVGAHQVVGGQFVNGQVVNGQVLLK